MPSQWDHRADKDLLLAIIEGENLKSVEWPAVSNRLSRKGYSFTKEACRYVQSVFSSRIAFSFLLQLHISACLCWTLLDSNQFSRVLYLWRQCI